MRRPRLLNKDGSERARLSPGLLSVSLDLSPPSSASMTLPPDSETVKIHDFVEIYRGEESLGVFRASSVNPRCGESISVALEHGIATLDDDIYPGSGSFTLTVAEAMQAILQKQTTVMWQLGRVETNDQITVEYNGTKLLQLVTMLMDSLPDYMLTYDQSRRPWTVNVVKLSNSIECECRLNRNISSLEWTLDDSDFCTRVYQMGSDVYYQSAAASVWGVKSKQIDLGINPALGAVEYLAAHDHPKLSIEIDAVDLSIITGESMDRFALGVLCRTTLPEYNTVFHERIVSLRYKNLLDEENSAQIMLSTVVEDTASTLIKNESFVKHSINDFEERVYHFEASAEEIETEMSYISQRQDENDETIDIFEKQISSVQQTSERLYTEISNVKETQQTLEETITGLEGSVIEIDTDIKTVDERVNDLEYTADGIFGEISSVKETQQIIEETVITLDGEVRTNSENITSITKSVNSLEVTSDVIAANLSKVQESQDVLEESVSQLENTSEQFSLELSKKVEQKDVNASIDAIETFENTAVRIDTSGMHVKTTGEIDFVVDNVLRAHIDETGVNAPRVVVTEEFSAPNAVLKNLSAAIPWKGGIQASLDAAPKWLTGYTELFVPAGTYQEDIVIRGFKGAQLGISLYQGVTINGGITIEQCDSVRIASSALGQAKIYPRDTRNVISAKNVGMLELNSLQISGYRQRTSAQSGTSIGVEIVGGVLDMSNCCVEYTRDYGVLFYMGASGTVNDCIGGLQGGDYRTNANLGYGILGSSGCHFAVLGKCPRGNTMPVSGWLSTVLGADAVTPTDGGMEYVAPAQITKTFAISRHCTYLYGVSRLRDDQSAQFAQGHYGGYASGGLNWRTGAMWFSGATAELAGKTILSATLTLRRATGGFSNAVPVYLGYTPLTESNYTSTLTPSFTQSTNNYPGASISRESEMTYDVTQLMNAVKSGYAIALREPTRSYSGNYSPAYTQFYGKGSGFEPMLTVTYK